MTTKTEWSIVCALCGLDPYTAGQRSTKTAETRAALLEDRNRPRTGKVTPLDSCRPWRLEFRTITDWAPEAAFEGAGQ